MFLIKNILTLRNNIFIPQKKKKMLNNRYDERVELVPIQELVGNELNPRDIKKLDFQQLMSDIEGDPDFFIGKPIFAIEDIATGKKVVYAGNQRLQACKMLGYKEVNTCIAYNLPDSVMKKRALLDNHHHGTWNLDMLANHYDFEELSALGDKFLRDTQIPNISDFSEHLDSLQEELEGNNVEDGDNAKELGMVIKYEIIFDSIAQRTSWDNFLIYLRNVYEEAETVSERLSLHTETVLQSPHIFARFSLIADLCEKDATFLDKLDTLLRKEATHE